MPSLMDTWRIACNDLIMRPFEPRLPVRGISIIVPTSCCGSLPVPGPAITRAPLNVKSKTGCVLTPPTVDHGASAR